MKNLRISTLTGALAIMLLAAVNAGAITVQEIGVNPFETPIVSITGIGTVTVYAGVNKLLVDGVPTDGFCIDPFHWSLASSSSYSYEALASGPKGAAMGSTVALEVERLWGSYYSTALTSPTVAAGLQIAIWKLVGGSAVTLVSGNDYGAAGYINNVSSLTYSGPVANLIALTGPGQDYTVPAPIGNGGSVPDGGTTAILLGAALCGVAAMGRKLRST
jgi:hypothetical protein